MVPDNSSLPHRKACSQEERLCALLLLWLGLRSRGSEGGSGMCDLGGFELPDLALELGIKKAEASAITVASLRMYGRKTARGRDLWGTLAFYLED